MTIILISTLLAMLRAVGVKNQSFRAVANLWMGMLITLWWLGGPAAGFYLWMIVLLSGFDVLCFFVHRDPPRPHYTVAHYTVED